MNTLEMICFAKFINANKYKYNYGRQANKTLKDILIPDEIPDKLLDKTALYLKNTINSINGWAACVSREK
jgi:hypothetical protein